MKRPIRYVDIGAELTRTTPPIETDVYLDEGERIVSVETIKDNFGYSWMRVWVVAHPNTDSESA